MWDVIAAVIGLLLAVYGAADLTLRLCWRVIFAGEDTPFTVTVTVDESAEYRLRRLAAWMRFCPKGFTPRVALTAPSESLKRLCEQLGFTVEDTLQDHTSAV